MHRSTWYRIKKEYNKHDAHYGPVRMRALYNFALMNKGARHNILIQTFLCAIQYVGSEEFIWGV